MERVEVWRQLVRPKTSEVVEVMDEGAGGKGKAQRKSIVESEGSAEEEAKGARAGEWERFQYWWRGWRWGW